MNQFHSHGLYNLFYFRGSHQLYVILKKFKMIEILHVIIFDIICTFSLSQIVNIIPCIYDFYYFLHKK
jgi:hypothetical protein